MFDEAKIKFNMPVRRDRPYKLWKRTYPREFFNRKDALKTIESCLQDKSSHQPIVIIGERRAGKTSLLLHLAEKHQEDFILLHAPEYGIQTAIAFYQALWMDVAPDESPPPDHVTHVWWQEKLIRRMEALVEKEKRPILLWIDELDTIFENEKMSDEEKGKILGFFLELIERIDFPLKLVFSITHKFPDVSHLRSSPLSYKAFRIPLEPFPREAAEGMVQSTLADDRSWDEIAPFWDWSQFCHETGCQPYYMKALLVHLGRVWRRHEGRIDKETWWEEAIQATLQDETFSKAFEHIYKKHFNKQERAVLLWMVRSDGSLQRASLKQAGLLLTAENLAKRFYLQEEEQRFIFRLGLLRRWLAQWPRFEDEWRQHKHHVQDNVESNESLPPGVQLHHVRRSSN